MHLFLREMQTAFMSHRTSTYMKKRHVLIRPHPPSPNLTGYNIPRFFIQKAVIICFCSIGRMISGSSQVIREHMQPFRHRNLFHLPVQMNTYTRSITPRNQRRTCCRADRRVAVCVIEHKTSTRQLFHVGSNSTEPSLIIDIQKIAGNIFRHKPDKVGTYRLYFLSYNRIYTPQDREKHDIRHNPSFHFQILLIYFLDSYSYLSSALPLH